MAILFKVKAELLVLTCNKFHFWWIQHKRRLGMRPLGKPILQQANR
jgi:hypothetical protein